MAFFPCSPASYERLFSTLVPADYECSLKDENEGSGFDIFAAAASVFGDVEQRLNTSQQAYYLKPHSTQTGPSASSGAKATGTVEISRTLVPTIGTLDFAVAIPQGTRLQAFYRPDQDGEDLLVQTYQTTTSVTLQVGDPGPITVPVEAIFEGYDGNIPAGLIDAFEPVEGATVPVTITQSTQVQETVIPGVDSDSFQASFNGRYITLTAPAPLAPLVSQPIPRQISTVVTPQIAVFNPGVDAGDVGKQAVVTVVSLADLGVTISQPNPITGGVADSLAAIGVDRNTGRSPGETDQQYCDRLQELADIISPNAIRRIATRVLSPFGIPFVLKETRDPDGLGGFVFDLSPFDFGGLTFEPGIDPLTQGSVFLGPGAYRRFFLICVGERNVGQFGLTFDSLEDFSAFDAGDPTLNFFDGSNAGFDAVIARLYDEIDAARAAGIGFAIVKDPNL